MAAFILLAAARMPPEMSIVNQIGDVELCAATSQYHEIPWRKDAIGIRMASVVAAGDPCEGSLLPAGLRWWRAFKGRTAHGIERQTGKMLEI